MLLQGLPAKQTKQENDMRYHLLARTFTLRSQHPSLSIASVNTIKTLLETHANFARPSGRRRAGRVHCRRHCRCAPLGVTMTAPAFEAAEAEKVYVRMMETVR